MRLPDAGFHRAGMTAQHAALRDRPATIETGPMIHRRAASPVRAAAAPLGPEADKLRAARLAEAIGQIGHTAVHCPLHAPHPHPTAPASSRAVTRSP
jgi:hypothetical protein